MNFDEIMQKKRFDETKEHKTFHIFIYYFHTTFIYLSCRSPLKYLYKRMCCSLSVCSQTSKLHCAFSLKITKMFLIINFFFRRFLRSRIRKKR